MQLEKLFLELKNDRNTARNRVVQHMQNVLIDHLKGGFFPDLKIVVNEIMAEIARLIDKFPNIPIEAWSIIFQDKDPNRQCEKTMKFVGQSECKKTQNDAQGVETKKT